MDYIIAHIVSLFVIWAVAYCTVWLAHAAHSNQPRVASAETIWPSGQLPLVNRHLYRSLLSRLARRIADENQSPGNQLAGRGVVSLQRSSLHVHPIEQHNPARVGLFDPVNLTLTNK
jgi:hypothetical protein